jgi:hypothetical protein
MIVPTLQIDKRRLTIRRPIDKCRPTHRKNFPLTNNPAELALEHLAGNLLKKSNSLRVARVSWLTLPN